jgi:capsid protein
MAMVLTSDIHGPLDTTEEGTTEDPAQAIRLGGVARLFPGEKAEAFSHTRPSQQIKPFREMLRGDIAAALRIPSRFLDRDVSRANYSSMRADMLDTDRLLAPVREWYGHATAGRLYKKVLPYLAIKAGIPVPKKTGYRLLPDGQPYVDPQKDADAALTAINGGLTTHTKEIAKRGEDRQKVWAELAKEKKESKPAAAEEPATVPPKKAQEAA